MAAPRITHLTSVASTALVLLLTSACSNRGAAPRPSTPIPLLGTAGAASTARADLTTTIARMEARLADRPDDIKAAVTLADALLRQTRVAGNPGLAMRAEAVLKAALQRQPDNYDARRMLTNTWLSQHRFREALAEAKLCLAARSNDAWLYGAMGDAHLELGEYPQAFDAFDRMVALKPNAASYARVSYARELQGDLPGALNLMKMAAEATSAQDPESLAWHHAQLGHLYLEMGRLADARQEYAHADYAFPGHPFAMDGLARVKAAEGDEAGALALVMQTIATSPTPADLAFAGDLLLALGRRDDAERQYMLAEAAWRSDAPEPARLARFLVERGRRLDEALRMAEAVAADRRDIFTEDALAWGYFATGNLVKAQEAMAQALRTGSRDRIIRYHAAAIAQAAGHRPQARVFVDEALRDAPRFDLIAAPAAAALKAALGAL